MRGSGRWSGRILRDSKNRVVRQNQLAIFVLLEASGVLHELRPIENEGQKAGVGGIRFRENLRNRLGEETHRNRGFRVGDGHIQRRCDAERSRGIP